MSLGLAANFRDAYSLRLGGEWDISDKFAVRAGAFTNRLR